MTDIRARIRVDPDHRISGTAPADVPPGEHEVTIIVARPQRAEKRPRIAGLPTASSISLTTSVTSTGLLLPIL